MQVPRLDASSAKSSTFMTVLGANEAESFTFPVATSVDHQSLKPPSLMLIVARPSRSGHRTFDSSSLCRWPSAAASSKRSQLAFHPLLVLVVVEQRVQGAAPPIALFPIRSSADAVRTHTVTIDARLNSRAYNGAGPAADIGSAMTSSVDYDEYAAPARGMCP